MPLPPEVLEEIKQRLEKSEKGIKDLEQTIADFRVSGIDVLHQEEELRTTKELYRKMRMFYGLQAKRTE